MRSVLRKVRNGLNCERIKAEFETFAKAREHIAAYTKLILSQPKLSADTISRLETEASFGLMADGTAHGQRSAQHGQQALQVRHKNCKMPKPPPGYRWESAPVDSGCTTVILKRKTGFINVTGTDRVIRIATNNVVNCEGEGTFCFTLLSKDAQLVNVSAKGAVYSSELRNLIASAVFEDMGHKVVFDGKQSHISLRENGKKFASIPLR